MNLPAARKRRVVKGFVKALDRAFGPEFHAVISYHIRIASGNDGFEAIWDEPKALYAALSRLFGGNGNADIFIRVILRAIGEERGQEAADGFINAMKADNVRKVRAVLEGLLCE